MSGVKSTHFFVYFYKILCYNYYINEKKVTKFMKLYKVFDHWQYTDGKNQNAIWIYSDPHFGDADCPIMDARWPAPAAQVKMINSKVGKKDTIIFLGDIGDKKYIRQIKGYKILIMGNHDAGASNYEKKFKHLVYNMEDYNEDGNLLRQELSKNYPDSSFSIVPSWEFHEPFKRFNVTISDNMFDEVYEGPVMINDKIILSHEPIYLPYMFNIHGHDHSNWHQGENKLNVASNVIEWTPINLTSLAKKGLTSQVPSIHRYTIDKIEK
jgi:calcineurin-like phosphoesterase family protein